MFLFCFFVMVPLYNLFCEVTGINGKTRGKSDAVEVRVDTERTVEVSFVSINNEGMPWVASPRAVLIPGANAPAPFSAARASAGTR